jgi:5-hydroxyisourate hydrolase
MSSKDQITCHVLDTTTGRPAADISVSLTCTNLPESLWKATTDADGRVTKWLKMSGSVTQGISQVVAGYEGGSVWKLTFDTGTYFGAGKTFFPSVDLTFSVEGTEHYHVPLLLGPHSYTTYRGS